MAIDFSPKQIVRSKYMTTKMKAVRSERLEKLKHLLAREKMTLAEVRKLLVPLDPWEAARGLWKDRKVNAVREVQRLRKEWDRI